MICGTKVKIEPTPAITPSQTSETAHGLALMLVSQLLTNGDNPIKSMLASNFVNKILNSTAYSGLAPLKKTSISGVIKPPTIPIDKK